MASQKIIDLLRALKHGTETRQVHWEDLPDEEMFRTQLGGGLIRIGLVAEGAQSGYRLTLLGINGSIAAETTFYRGEAGYDLIEELFDAARLKARGGDFIIDNILQQLAPAGG